MKITRETVLHVAELANLELSEAEVETYRRQLDEILSYVEKLNQLDTSGVEPMAQVVAADAAAAWREDVVRPAGITDQALAAAPDAAPPYFRVPKVIERES
ncbi:MAG TPA: Asp-tRNA(Asn)/Glu-tRNA(Gln) amidotransferase subunit GatC [Candidatus Acidoferrales bacterium]|nr:Asp-tRNA(Asn)/Glu-tRNA(Gln) amidotransferase subunit GatC [Candidatus Acidoferrales bacterium]